MSKPKAVFYNRSLERALQILRAFSFDVRELTLGELSGTLNLSKATVYRLASTLTPYDFLRYDETSRKYALGGGCELAMSCDIRIASDNAKFGLTEAKLGLMPGYGGTQLLPRLVGMGAAKYLIFSGEMITAEEAYRLGLVERVCSSETLMEEVDELAKKISSNGHFAVRACKRAINVGTQLSVDEALKLELAIYDKVARSADAEEGIAAFLEKRAPTFKAR